MKKKVISIIALFTLILLSCTPVMALTINTENTTKTNTENTNTNTSTTTGKTIMEVVEKNICEINLNDMGKFTKELTNFNADKKEVTLTLTVENIMEKEKITKPVEIYLVLDNSYSMTKTYNGKSKMEYVKETASAFTDALFEYFTNPKIGLVSFSSVDTTASGGVSIQLGTINDANLLLPLSNSKDAIKSKITEYTKSNGQYTNIEAGLSLAQTNFTTSTDSEKYVILLSDGVPNLSLDTTHTLTYSGTNAANTKKKLQDMNTAGYHTFSVLMGLNESNIENPNAPQIEDGTRHMTYRELAEEIFGTASKPTAGDFFFIDYDNLSTTINDKIFGDITAIKDNSLKNIVIKDYFPKEIIENFNFTHVKSPNIGKVSEKIDTTNNSITWNIELLEEGQIATLSYKLTLKDNYNKEIINKVLPTNSKVDIDFKTADGNGEAYSDVSPSVRVKYDETTAGGKIPQTGIDTPIFLAIIIAGIIVFAVIRVKQINDMKK